MHDCVVMFGTDVGYGGTRARPSPLSTPHTPFDSARPSIQLQTRFSVSCLRRGGFRGACTHGIPLWARLDPVNVGAGDQDGPDTSGTEPTGCVATRFSWSRVRSTARWLLLLARYAFRRLREFHAPDRDSLPELLTSGAWWCQASHASAPWISRVIPTYAGWRPSEALTVSTVALHHTFSELLLFLAERSQTSDVSFRIGAGFSLSENDVAEIARVHKWMVYKTSVETTGFHRDGSKVDREIAKSLVAFLERVHSLDILDADLVYAAAR